MCEDWKVDLRIMDCKEKYLMPICRMEKRPLKSFTVTCNIGFPRDSSG
jgi:hypothetical protein